MAITIKHFDKIWNVTLTLNTSLYSKHWVFMSLNLRYVIFTMSANIINRAKAKKVKRSIMKITSVYFMVFLEM